MTSPPAFPHRHLLGIAGLQPHEISYLLDQAEHWVTHNRQAAKHDDRLRGLTQINAFFENSTRTLLSFEIAGKRLGADVVNMHAAQSSVKKGETLIDTAITLNAMRSDVLVIRHGSSGAVALIADKVDCPVLNAGDGRHEHPTQALLDAFTGRSPSADPQATGMEIREVRATVENGKAVLTVRVRGLGGEGRTLLLIEGPDFVRVTEVNHQVTEETHIAVLKLTVGSTSQFRALKGKRIRITLIDNGRALEQTWVVGTQGSSVSGLGLTPVPRRPIDKPEPWTLGGE